VNDADHRAAGAGRGRSRRDPADGGPTRGQFCAQLGATQRYSEAGARTESHLREPDLSGCGPGGRGFESRRSPLKCLQTATLRFVGVSRAGSTRGQNRAPARRNSALSDAGALRRSAGSACVGPETSGRGTRRPSNRGGGGALDHAATSENDKPASLAAGIAKASGLLSTTLACRPRRAWSSGRRRRSHLATR
jgi:hypothetical protein